jgi:two-component system OmpR family response regulator
MRVLIIEDDHRLVKLMVEVLQEDHIDVDVAYNGDVGLELIMRGIYDIAIVDWMLPGRDGPAICRAARTAELHTSLLMLTARGEIEDRVTGLDSGADDYLVKPFAFDELLARLRSLGRRSANLIGDPSELRCGDVVLDLRAHTARQGSESLNLTATEWNLLEFLMRHPRQTMTRAQILDYVWSFETRVEATQVDVYIFYLRRKLRLSGKTDPIKTVRGIGYRLEMNDV